MRKAVLFAVQMGILAVFCRALLTDFWAARVSGWLWETLFYGVPGLAAFGLSRWIMVKRRERYSLGEGVAAVVLAPLCSVAFSLLPGVFSGTPALPGLPSAFAVAVDVAVWSAALALAVFSLRGRLGASQ